MTPQIKAALCTIGLFCIIVGIAILPTSVKEVISTILITLVAVGVSVGMAYLLYRAFLDLFTPKKD